MNDTDADDIESIKERKLEEMMEGGGAEAEAGGAAAPDEPIHVEDEAHFDEIVDTYDVVLVDLYADWCGPCKMVEPIVASIADSTGAAVAKVDVDRHQGLARRMNVQGVPTLYLYADGEPVKRMVGVQDEATLSDLVGQYGA